MKMKQKKLIQEKIIYLKICIIYNQFLNIFHNIFFYILHYVTYFYEHTYIPYPIH